MKKIIVMLLIISFALSLTSCGNKTKLTLENFEEYLNITTICKADGYSTHGTIATVSGEFKRNAELFRSIISSTSVEGVSQNFNHRDIVIKISVIGTYKEYHETWDSSKYSGGDDKDFSFEYEIKLNISGNGSNTSVHELTSIYRTTNESIVYDIAIVSISGYVEAA